MMQSAVFSLLIVFVSAAPAFAQQGQSGETSSLELLFLGIMAFFVYRMFARRRDGNKDDQSKKPNDQVTRREAADRYEAARQMWDMLGGEEEQSAGASQNHHVDSSGEFDSAEFMEGVKLFYARMREAMDSGQFDSLHAFISPTLLDEFKQGRYGEPGAYRTEVMLIDTRLMNVDRQPDQTTVSVLIDALLKKGVSGSEQESHKVAWTFVRDERTPGALWILSKIDRVDN